MAGGKVPMKNKRNTLQRRLILIAVEELGIHATAEQVYEHVVKVHPSISKATVYRNLSQLAEAGELLSISNLDDATHYDHQCHEHYHFICDACKRIFDVEGNLSDVIGRFTDTNGFDITNCNISFSGLCWDCQARQK